MHTPNEAPSTVYVSTRTSSLAKVGGALGIAATLQSLAIFVVALFGLNAAFMFSPIPVLFGIAGIIVTVCGGVVHTAPGHEETQPIAALFACLAGLVGGAIELMFWSWMWH
jgi:hypothetical protein